MNQFYFMPCLSVGCSLLAGGFAQSLYSETKADRPNVLWLTSEDNNIGWIGCYGNKLAHTPTIDRLASEGFQYMNAFASAPVCAPSRSTWITGINAISMGTQGMRSRYKIPHDKISYYPDVLRKLGYYCGNYPKTDYNIGGRNDKECWDNSGPVNWDNLKKHQPFFQVINTAKSHENQAKRQLDNTRHSPDNVNLHLYHPDLKTIRKNYARYYDCIENMDAFEGAQLAALKKAGLADNTIVIYCSDHGGVLPRSKRFLFDSGLHSPLIIYIPEKFKNLWPAEKPGTKIYRLVSFVDMPKTWISMLGGVPPQAMQGKIFLGPAAEPEPEYVFAFRGRMDERYDNQRAVRDKRFLYVKNYMPYVPWGQKLEYMWQMPAYKAWSDYFKAGKTDAVTGRFFTEKNGDELYDTVKDPDNVNNLIDNPEYKEVLARMRKKLTAWQERIYDAGLMPEAEIVKRARDNNTTVYEMVRNPALYNLKAYLEISDIALEKNPGNLSTLQTALESKDSAIRYWGIVGCFMIAEDLGDSKSTVYKLLNDPSHEVRGMAAWTLCKINYKKNDALLCLKKLLNSNSYDLLSILNIIDWIGEDAKALIPDILALRSKNNNIMKMQRTLLEKFDIPVPPELKAVPHAKKRKKKKS